MIKRQLVKEIAREVNLKQYEVKEVLESFMRQVKKAVSEGKKVSLVDFGTFIQLERSEKRVKNPSTKETIVIPKTVVPTFRPGKEFKSLVKNKKS